MINKFDLIKSLRNCILLSHLDDNEIHNMLNSEHCILRHYNQDDIIFLEKESCSYLSIIIKGTIEIQKLDSNGNLLIISSLKCGDTFGENLLFGDINTYPMNVVSKTPSIVFHINKNYIYKMCISNELFLKELLRSLSNKALNLNSRLKEVSMKSLRQMICNFLILEYNKTKNPLINLSMSKKEWADTLGVQRPSLSRELKNLKEDGLIDYDRNHITILNLPNIEKFL